MIEALFFYWNLLSSFKVAQHNKELTSSVSELEQQKTKFENDLKTSVDKIYELREIIVDLESQVATKTLNEEVLHGKCIELENRITSQTIANESLRDELHKLDSEILNKSNAAEYSSHSDNFVGDPAAQLDHMVSQLKTVELLLDRKTKTLENFHALGAACSTTCSSPSEDVSKSIDIDVIEQSPVRTKRQTDFGGFHTDIVQKILDKLTKHNRIEEATLKKITDMEMQLNIMRGNVIVSKQN